MDHEYPIGIKRYSVVRKRLLLPQEVSQKSDRSNERDMIMMTDCGNLDKVSLRVVKKIRKTKQNR